MIQFQTNAHLSASFKKKHVKSQLIHLLCMILSRKNMFSSKKIEIISQYVTPFFSKCSNRIIFIVVLLFEWDLYFFSISLLYSAEKRWKNMFLFYKSLLISNIFGEKKKFVVIKTSCNNQCIWICYRAWIVQTWSFLAVYLLMAVYQFVWSSFSLTHTNWPINWLYKINQTSWINMRIQSLTSNF